MSEFRRLRRFLRLPSRSAARIRRDVDDELRLHIELRVEELVRAGMSPADARSHAMRRFGDIEDAASYCADIDRGSDRQHRVNGWLSEIRQDVAHTFRVLRRSAAFAAATVLTLGAAIGASTAVYGVLHTFVFRPLPYPESDRLVSILDTPTLDRRFPRMPSLQGVDWSAVDSLFDATASWDLDGFTVLGSPFAENVVGAWVTPGYFKVLSLTPAIGRAFVASEYREQTPVAIISDARDAATARRDRPRAELRPDRPRVAHVARIRARATLGARPTDGCRCVRRSIVPAACRVWQRRRRAREPSRDAAE